MEIVTGITAAKGAFDLSRSIQSLLASKTKENVAEALTKMLELQQLILETQRQLGDAAEKNSKLSAAVDELKRIEEEFGKHFVYAEGIYWKDDYPFCSNCWDVERKPMRLYGPYSPPIRREGYRMWKCSTH